MFNWVVRTVKMVSAFADVEFSRTSSMNKKLVSMFPVLLSKNWTKVISISRTDTSVTSSVRRPKQYAFFTFSNKLSRREPPSAKNISLMEPYAEYRKCFISSRPSTVNRLTNDENFRFETSSLTSQYAAIKALHMTSSLTSFLSCTSL